MDRATRCILGWDVVEVRTRENMQACLDQGPRAKQYYSDHFPIYGWLSYFPGYHSFAGKDETYSVEAVNADLRHYLARLGRRSRCFSRCAKALKASLRIFVYYYNQRQLYRLQFPAYRLAPSQLVCTTN